MGSEDTDPVDPEKPRIKRDPSRLLRNSPSACAGHAATSRRAQLDVTGRHGAAALAHPRPVNEPRARVAKRKKADLEAEPKPKAPPKVVVSLGSMLKGLKLEPPKPRKASPAQAPKPDGPSSPAPTKDAVAKPTETKAARPSEGLRGGDRTIFYEAMSGVARLEAGTKQRAGRVVASPPPQSDPVERRRDEEARARLRALVGGGARFDVREDDDYVEASAEGTPESVMRQLLRARPGPSLPSLDLHGAKEHEVEARVSRFVRGAEKKASKRVLIIHGKGLHSAPGASAQGRSILGRATVQALTQGGAAPLVRAFVSAPSALGGTGALLVELR